MEMCSYVCVRGEKGEAGKWKDVEGRGEKSRKVRELSRVEAPHFAFSVQNFLTLHSKSLTTTKN